MSKRSECRRHESSKKAPKAPRNNVAYGMIMAGTGKGQTLRDRRERRPKDAKHSWQRDQER